MRIKAFRVECCPRQACWWMALGDAHVNGRQRGHDWVYSPYCPIIDSQTERQCSFNLLFLVAASGVLMQFVICTAFFPVCTFSVLLFIHFWPPSSAGTMNCVVFLLFLFHQTLSLLIRRLSISRERLSRVSVMHHVFIHLSLSFTLFA